MTEHAIEVRQVSKRFGAIQAVELVDLQVARGEMLGLIGHNGAGKSTLFKMMLGLIPVSSGEILVEGTLIGSRGFRDVRRRVGYVPENVVLYDNLTGLETVQFFARLKGVDRRDCIRVLERVGLAKAIHRRVNGYSKGMRQRLGFAQALLGKPQILFLDEPTNGLDPEAIREFYKMLAELQSEGVTLVITSHILAEIQQRVSRLAIMAAGKIQAQGSLQELRERIALPVQIRIQLGEQADFEGGTPPAIERLRARGLAVELHADGVLEVTCQRAAKMETLSLLSQMGPQLADLDIHEPSLEDVFFGLSH
ncbi:Putative ATP-binding protein, putative ABC transporter for copper [gamma proteobacterium HdN1]|nr:Putative ATP-binding protein, putative ABC transporter for copper [gamma proteobacterium HdN1]